MSLKDLKNRLLTAFPVIGPHADIEAELLLAGKKNLGWVNLLPADLVVDDTFPAVMRKQAADEKKLEQAVIDGWLIAADVTVPGPEGHVFITRHYAQPGHEEDLRIVAAFNQKAFNREKISPEDLPRKDAGEYLGYRKRDRMLWELIHKPIMPKCVIDAIFHINEHYTQPAYQARAVEKAQKEIDRRQKNLQKSGPAL